MCSVLYGTPEEVSLEIASITSELKILEKSIGDLNSLEINEDDKKKQLQALNQRRRLQYDRIRNFSRSIKKDTSILEYRGLLAMGRIHYKSKSRTYDLYIYAGDNEYGPKHTVVTFEVDGRIRRSVYAAMRN